jgi:hypothetical protein
MAQRRKRVPRRAGGAARRGAPAGGERAARRGAARSTRHNKPSSTDGPATAPRRRAQPRRCSAAHGARRDARCDAPPSPGTHVNGHLDRGGDQTLHLRVQRRLRNWRRRLGGHGAALRRAQPAAARRARHGGRLRSRSLGRGRSFRSSLNRSGRRLLSRNRRLLRLHRLLIVRHRDGAARDGRSSVPRQRRRFRRVRRAPAAQPASPARRHHHTLRVQRTGVDDKRALARNRASIRSIDGALLRASIAPQRRSARQAAHTWATAAQAPPKCAGCSVGARHCFRTSRAVALTIRPLPTRRRTARAARVPAAMGLTERQQLATALRESRAAAAGLEPESEPLLFAPATHAPPPVRVARAAALRCAGCRGPLRRLRGSTPRLGARLTRGGRCAFRLRRRPRLASSRAAKRSWPRWRPGRGTPTWRATRRAAPSCATSVRRAPALLPNKQSTARSAWHTARRAQSPQAATPGVPRRHAPAARAFRIYGPPAARGQPPQLRRVSPSCHLGRRASAAAAPRRGCGIGASLRFRAGARDAGGFAAPHASRCAAAGKRRTRNASPALFALLTRFAPGFAHARWCATRTWAQMRLMLAGGERAPHESSPPLRRRGRRTLQSAPAPACPRRGRR